MYKQYELILDTGKLSLFKTVTKKLQDQTCSGQGIHWARVLCSLYSNEAVYRLSGCCPAPEAEVTESNVRGVCLNVSISPFVRTYLLFMNTVPEKLLRLSAGGHMLLILCSVLVSARFCWPYLFPYLLKVRQTFLCHWAAIFIQREGRKGQNSQITSNTTIFISACWRRQSTG